MRKLLTGVALGFLFSSCATVFSGSRQKFTFISNVDSSNVSVINNVNGREVFAGKTPVTTKLRRSSGYFQKADYIVKFSAPGYQDKSTTIPFRINTWYWFNIVLGGAIGMVGVDPGTGAMWNAKESNIRVELSK